MPKIELKKETTEALGMTDEAATAVAEMDFEDEAVGNAFKSVFETSATEIGKLNGIKTEIVEQRNKIKTEKQETDTKLTTLQTEYEALKLKINDNKTTNLKDKGEFDQALKLKEDEFKVLLGKKEEENVTLKSFQRQTLIDSEIIKGLVAAKVKDHTKVLPYIHTVYKFDTEEVDGKIVGKIVSGEKAMDQDGNNKPISQAVQDFMTNGNNDEYLDVEGSGGAGSGGGAGGGGGGGDHVFTRKEIKAMDRPTYLKNQKKILEQAKKGLTK